MIYARLVKLVPVRLAGDNVQAVSGDGHGKGSALGLGDFSKAV